MHEQDFQHQLLSFLALNNECKENDNKGSHHEF